ncbi:formyl transferase [Magnetospirillum gryphiswaldense]|uniref:Methionyl-tRNA formyltransferase n=1 Tax=Magnetospirillum gryphiswaldense TaxID=55518 RepID=A4U2P6_9PROT|nr:formyl transferase [Magnetospirillum gryphiswaldense]AVM74770.1 Methionyl-tRNA formyltransferase [Magnetospirillum gryphiswaldense MSR-1]AVM78673.1 Methionyl-tRNA formyltransferase [Magnetospirillum gryphiswaldense]CAM77153.1 Methionyl-tRNA formyltransferase [Magnetospirillum gryphiswaldense MSR-1]
MNKEHTPLRIVICTKRDLAGALILNQLLPRLGGDTVMVLLSDKTRPVEQAVPELAEMKFLERDLPMDTLFPLIDRLDDDGAPAELATFDGLAQRFGVPIQVIGDINGPEGEEVLRRFAPDIMLSARFSLIFRRNVFDIPRFGTYNVHPGALPRYAGLFAPFRCMLEGGDAIGCTLHRVDDGIDTGPVVGIGWLPIQAERSLLWHVVNTYGAGLDLFMTVLDGLRQGQGPDLQGQDRSLRVYGSLPGREAFDAFRAKGLRLYDPQEYMDVLRRFMPAESAVQLQAIAGAAAEKVGASCCCAHA